MTTTPSPPDWRGLCEELLEALDGWHKAVFETGTGWVRPDETYLLDRARAALSQPEPEVVGPTDEEVEVWADQQGFIRGHGDHPCGFWIDDGDAGAFARAVLARWGRPAPVPAGDSALRDAAQLALTTLEGWSNYDQWVWPISAMEQAKRNTTEAVAALETALSRPAPAPAGERQAAPVPVAVSERSTQIEDLAADAVSALRYIEQGHGRLYGVGWDRVYEKADHLRPAQALPLPGGEVEA